MAGYFTKKLGCCSSGPVMAGIGDPLDESAIVATGPAGIAGGMPGVPPGTLRSLFAVSVGAGLTVWALTRLLGSKRTT